MLFDSAEMAIHIASRKAHKHNKLYSVLATPNGWEVCNFQVNNLQGWHFSQIMEQDHFIATPTGLINASDFPVVFMVENFYYLGSARDQAAAAAANHYPIPIHPDHLVGNQVFVPGNPKNWQLADITPLPKSW